MNNIIYTTKAKEIKENDSFIYSPEFIDECFEGLISLTGCNSPNINVGLNKLDSYIKKIKSHPSLITYTPDKRVDADSFLNNPKNNNLTYLKQKLSVCCVTTIDALDNANIEVLNIFTKQYQSIKIPKPYGKPFNVLDLPYDPKSPQEFNGMIPPVEYLGTYLPSVGCILLYLDNIIKVENPEIIFQKVLVHEFIHALLDINLRIIKNSNSKAIGNNKDIQLSDLNIISLNDREEELTNTLVLHTYENWNKTDVYSLNIIKDFIVNQPSPYNNAIKLSKIPLDCLSNDLLDFLIHKIQYVPL